MEGLPRGPVDFLIIWDIHLQGNYFCGFAFLTFVLPTALLECSDFKLGLSFKKRVREGGREKAERA